MQKVTVRQNLAKPLPGKHINFDPDKDTFTEFKNKCSEHLGINIKRVFTT